MKTLKEWCVENNEMALLELYKSGGNTKKVWWKCKKGHSWETSVCNRTKGMNCPICW